MNHHHHEEHSQSSSSSATLTGGEIDMLWDGIHPTYELVGFSDDEVYCANQTHFRNRLTGERFMAPPIFSDGSGSHLADCVECKADDTPLSEIRLVPEFENQKAPAKGGAP